jgi:hypothetical protein
VLDYMQDDMPYPPYVYEALGETFSQNDLGRLLMSMAKWRVANTKVGQSGLYTQRLRRIAVLTLQ